MKEMEEKEGLDGLLEEPLNDAIERSKGKKTAEEAGKENDDTPNTTESDGFFRT